MSIRRHFYIFRIYDHRCRLCFLVRGHCRIDQPDTIFRTLSRASTCIFSDDLQRSDKSIALLFSCTNRPTVRWKHHLSECNWEITEDPSFNDHYRPSSSRKHCRIAWYLLRCSFLCNLQDNHFLYNQNHQGR